MSYLQSINRLSGDNMGGIVLLHVARKADIVSMGPPVNGSVYGNIVFREGTGFVTWQVTLTTPRMRSEGRSSREGAYKSNRLEFIIAKDVANVRSMLLQAEQDEFIILFTDANNQQKVFGLPEAPVRFLFDHDSGGDFSARNGYECRFYYEGPENIYTYNGAFDQAPGAGAPAIVRVNGVVVAQLYPGEIIDFDTDFEFDFEIIGTNQVITSP
jgi:hypothetical protein